MKKQWFVVDSEDFTIPWDDDKECGEAFESKDAAENKALSLAKDMPGKRFLVCETTSFAESEVQEPHIIALGGAR